MNQMWLLVLLVAGGAAGLGAVVVGALQQHEHRVQGLLPGLPDPRTTTTALLKTVLGEVPVRWVGAQDLAFEDGSGLLLHSPDRAAMCELSGWAAARDVVLERVDQLSVGLRLVFRGGERRLAVDVDALKMVTGT